MSVRKARPIKTKSSTVPKEAKDNRIAVQNVNVPGYVTRVDATKYGDMKRALLKALPSKPPGLTQTEMRKAVLPYLSKKLFPDGGKVGWWAKCVQLDLEAKRALLRETSKPLRWHRRPAK